MAKKRTKLSDQIRRAIDGCGLTRYRISKETGIAEATLTRFMSAERGLPMKTLDRLADFLDLNITTGRPPAKKDR
ncbi:MAG: helix-turn-helix domain-containing protein [Planctomycetes bacterium]|nr:helix-turn-helix domain-containing protein [Planctomycetota bacterium]